MPKYFLLFSWDVEKPTETSEDVRRQFANRDRELQMRLDAAADAVRAPVPLHEELVELEVDAYLRKQIWEQHMRYHQSSSPPRFVEAALWLLLPRKVRDAIIGDAAEAFDQTIKRYPESRIFATADYCKEAFFAIFGAMRLSLAQCIVQIFRKQS